MEREAGYPEPGPVRRKSSVFSSLTIVLLGLFFHPTAVAAASFDQISNLKGKAAPLAVLKSQDNFANELRYEVRIKNLTGDAFIADSLIIVLDKVTNIGGFDREALKKEPLIDQIEVLNQDGTTPDGKAFFHVPATGAPDLPPFSESLPVTIRIRNPSYVTGLTPSFSVYGTIRPPDKTVEEPKRLERPTISPPSPTTRGDSLNNLIQLLIKKGIFTQEEWQKTNSSQPSPSPKKSPAPPSPPPPSSSLLKP